MHKFIIFLLLFSWVPVYTQDITIEKWDVYPNMQAVAFSPNGQHMAIAHENNYISLHNIVTGSQSALLKGHFHYITTMIFSSDSTLLASSGQDLLVKVWSVGNGTDILTLSGHNGPITCLAFSPNKKVLASGSKDKTIKIWSVTSGKLLKTLSDHNVEITQLAFNGDSSMLYSKSNVIKVWKVSVKDSATVVEEVKNAAYYYQQGMKAKQEGDIDTAIIKLEMSVNMDPKQIDGNYLLSCCYSLRTQMYDNSPIGKGKKGEDLRKSFEHLNNAIVNGYKDWDKIQTNKDLDAIRLEDSFQRLLSKFEVNKVETATEEVSNFRRISFYVKDIYGEAVAASEIAINGNKIKENDIFEANKQYQVVIKFKNYETLEDNIRIQPGVGPFIIEAPIRRLGEYKFSIYGSKSEIELDGITYAYEILIDSKPIPAHHLDIENGRVYTKYTMHVPNTASDIQIIAGYQVVEKRLYQVKGKSIRRFDQISIPLLIKHLEALSQRGRGRRGSIEALENLLKSIYYRQIFSKLSIDNLLVLFEDVERWQLYSEQDKLHRELLLSAINELIDGK